MANQTLIAWTDHTANFWMGCQKISPGCKHCYAERLTHDRMGLNLWGPGSRRQAVKNVYGNLSRWQKESTTGVPGILGPGRPHLVFVGSLMDWAEDHPDAEALRPRIWDEIRRYPELHFQLLTKRADRIAGLLPRDWGEYGYPNVWLGVSIESNAYANRARLLAEIPATVRFISYEPALGPLDELDLHGISWTIYGGESGPGYREHDPQWARDILAHCEEEGVAFFFKQSSAFRTEMGIELDGRIIRKFPELRSRREQVA